MFNTIVLGYLATELALEVAIIIVAYRKRRILVPAIKNLIRDLTGYTDVQRDIRNLTQAVDFNNSETDRRTRYATAVEKARRQHKRAPAYEEFV